MQLLEKDMSVEESKQYVTFKLNDEEYAIDALKVQEIVELGSVTRVPKLPEFFKGVINLRGTIIPVIDLKARFGMKQDISVKHPCVVVVEFSGGVMGLIVDSVSDVMAIGEKGISDPPEFGSGVKTDFLRGMGRVDERLVLILDMERVFTEKELTTLQEGG